jgi:Na+/proline symporter
MGLVTADYIVLLAFVIGVFAVGVFFGARNKDASQMFAAGGQSPWWAAGLSAFMTMFSAGTFVVWGGIAYKHGLVAVSINLCYGVAAILVGYTVAGRWKEIGISSPAEFVTLRFGTGVLHFYTWAMMVFRLLSVAVSLYALAVILTTKMDVSSANPFGDPTTGKLDVRWAILFFGGAVVFYTMIGGLWAVLMTDVLQFIVLNLAVLFVIPLLLKECGGIQGFVEAAPEGFFAPIGGGYTWWFLLGWAAIHYFVVGAEWAFVQRSLCVPSPRDARKGTYLFGTLYLVSPVLWLLPPMIYRTAHPIPDGASEAQIALLANQAYINACSVLPAGMMGLMLAAMFSATASMVSSQLNVFAGVLTTDILKPWFAGRPDEQRLLLRAGRGLTLLLGVVLVILALAVPAMGGAEQVVVAAASVMVTPLLAPILWGLLSPAVTTSTLWMTAGISGMAVAGWFVAKGTIASPAALATAEGHSLGLWISAHEETLRIAIGVGLPVAVLSILHWRARGVDPGWQRVAALPRPSLDDRTRPLDSLPARIVAGSVLACAAMMFALAIVGSQDRGLLGMFGSALLAIALGILQAVRRAERSAPGKASYAEV